MKCQSLIFVKNKKNINWSSAEYAHRVIKVNMLETALNCNMQGNSQCTATVPDFWALSEIIFSKINMHYRSPQYKQTKNVLIALKS